MSTLVHFTRQRESWIEGWTQEHNNMGHRHFVCERLFPVRVKLDYSRPLVIVICILAHPMQKGGQSI
jgi:hypothetical protein